MSAKYLPTTGEIARTELKPVRIKPMREKTAVKTDSQPEKRARLEIENLEITIKLVNPTLKPPSQNSILKVEGQDYIVGKKLGQGSQGSIFEVTNYLSNRKYALKWVAFEITWGWNEARNEIALYELKSYPAIVKIISPQIANRFVTIVMELGEESLHERLEKMRKEEWNLEYLKRYWFQTLTAVDTIHSKLIIHPVLKPKNFVFIPDRLKLIDFKLACKMKRRDKPVRRIGVPGT